jgi:hypothetical protein
VLLGSSSTLPKSTIGRTLQRANHQATGSSAVDPMQAATIVGCFGFKWAKAFEM